MEDRQGFARFVEEHMAVVYATAYSATGDRALSEEVAQETFLCAWRKLPALDRPPIMRAWLCGIARMMAKNVRRRRGRERPLAADDAPIASDGPSPLDALLCRERELLVRRALARMPVRYREPLVLYYQGEESVEAVASALGLTTTAVRQRLSRGRKHLRDEVHLVERELRSARPRAGLAAAIAAAFAPLAVARASSLSSLLSFAPAAAVCGLLAGVGGWGLGVGERPEAADSDPVTDPDPAGGGGGWGLGVGERTDPDADPDTDSDPDPGAELSFLPDPIASSLSPVPRSPRPVSVSSESDDFATAKELVRRGFPSGSLPHFERVLKRGRSDPHHRDAIANVARIARRLPDPSAAAALLANVPAADLPSDPDIDYLLARHHYAADPRRALVHLDAVPRGTPRYPDARLLAGVIHVRFGHTAAATRAFEAVLAARPTAAARDRALLALGRIHYGARRYHRAAETFARIRRRSPEWPTALFESTWAYLRAGDPARGLGHIHTLKAPHFAASPFPETAKVEAIFYFQRCHFRRAERVTRAFEARYAPVLRAVARLAATHAGDEAAFLATARSLRAARRSGSPASPAAAVALAPPTTDRQTRQLAADALADRELDRALDRIAQLDRELAHLAGADAAWRGSPLAVTLLQDLTLERHLAAQAAGRLARARLTRLAGELRALMGDMRRIRIEILQIRADSVGKTLPAEPEPAVFAIDDRATYWPFDGEYWRDELGRYYVDIAPVCPAR